VSTLEATYQPRVTRMLPHRVERWVDGKERRTRVAIVGGGAKPLDRGVVVAERGESAGDVVLSMVVVTQVPARLACPLDGAARSGGIALERRQDGGQRMALRVVGVPTAQPIDGSRSLLQQTETDLGERQSAPAPSIDEVAQAALGQGRCFREAAGMETLLPRLEKSAGLAKGLQPLSGVAGARTLERINAPPTRRASRNPLGSRRPAGAAPKGPAREATFAQRGELRSLDGAGDGPRVGH
jgi:hypothetical protein